MTLHHFVPLSILSTFASKDAWRLVDAPEKQALIASDDACVIKGGQRRNLPLCVYEKHTKRFIRRRARDVCSVPNLYSVFEPKDQVLKDFTKRFTQIALANHKTSFAPLDEDMIEKFQVGELDNSFAALLPALKFGQPLNEDQIDTVLRFILFAHIRTPLWQRVYYLEQYKPFMKLVTKQAIQSWNTTEVSKVTGKGIQTVNAVLDNLSYQLTIIMTVINGNSVFSHVNTKVRVLHNTGKTTFVTCDNPGRPYLTDQIPQISRNFLCGMGDTKCCVSYPIDPNTCLLITSNLSHPKSPIFAHESIEEKKVRKINSALALMADKEIIFSGPNLDVFENWVDLKDLNPI